MSARLNWSPVNGAVSYAAYDMTSGIAVYLGSTSAPGSTYVVTGLSPGTTYRFRVRLVDSQGLSDANATDLAVTTLSTLPPQVVTYPTNPATYLVGSTIAANLPSISGGTPSSFSISPALSTGLSFNTATGAITGTPSALLPSTVFTVTASNAGGSATATLTLTVNFAGATGIDDITGNTLRVNWSAAPGAKNYIVENVTSGSPVYIATLPSTAVNYIVLGLSISTAYKFRVRMIDSAGTQDSNTNDVAATTLPAVPGAFDTSFNGTGYQTTALGNANSAAYSAVVQADGKIVVGGYTHQTNNAFELSRYNPDGSLDSTYGSAGAAALIDFGLFLPNGSDDRISTLLLQPSDGKVVAVGPIEAVGGGSGADFGLARYNSDGTLDTTFGGGLLSHDFGHGYTTNTVGALQSNGKIVVAGTSGVGTWYSGIGIIRYNADGTLDTSFGTSGVVDGYPGGVGLNPAVQAVAIQPSDGKLLVAGCSFATSRTCGVVGGSSFVVARYTTAGALDTGFGASGYINSTEGFATGMNIVAVLVQSDGKIVLAGSQNTTGSALQFVLLRYLSDGSALDTTFGTTGIVTTSILAGGSQANAAILQPLDGKIVVVGTATSSGGTNSYYAAARYNPDGSLDTSFGTSGIVTTTSFGAGLASGYGVALQPSDRKLILLGAAPVGSFDDFRIVRLWP